jgi:imidazoleglycerol-phosphate dehydratase / histidinol-phosphatase
LSREGPIEVSTGLGFFDHMLEQIAKHGGFALRLRCKGDLRIDEHHTVEDCALALGSALREALGDKRGIARYGFLLAMDEAEAQVALDLSGRPYFVWEGRFNRERVGELPTELVPHFFRSLAETWAPRCTSACAARTRITWSNPASRASAAACARRFASKASNCRAPRACCERA